MRRAIPPNHAGAICKAALGTITSVVPLQFRFMPTSRFKSPIVPSLILVSVSFLALLPFFWLGIPSGHDFEFHMYSWMEVLSQWRQGVVYPRWDATAHWGYGEARFLFYPPASWTLGAALGAILPWKLAPGAYCWIALTAAGFSMYRLLREWLPTSDALFGAAFYALNPYHLLIVYWRSAFAELLAAVLLPLLLLALLGIRNSGARPVLGLSLVLAAAWLTNAPAALMIHYSAAGLGLLIAIHERSWRPLLRLAFAIALGLGLASFYLFPAIYEERWINIAEVLGPGVRPQDNFLFTTIADPDHNRFNYLVSSVALAEIALLAILLWVPTRLKDRIVWSTVSVWAAATAILMSSFSHPLWQYLPEFRFVQLPFRWLLCLNAALAILLVVAVQRWSLRTLTSAILLVVVLVTGNRVQRPWWDNAADIQEMHDATSSGKGNEGIDEYVPYDTDPYDVNKDAPRVAATSGASAKTRVIQWGAEEKRFVVETTRPTTLTVRMFDYPAWSTTVNGIPATTAKSEDTGQLLVPISAGTNEVEIRFTRTWDRGLGGIVSLVSVTAWLALWLLARKKSHPPLSS